MASSVLERRIRSVSYLREVFGGSRHWVSVAAIGKEPDGSIEESQTMRWFFLGVSAATLLPQPAGAPFLRALLQLLEEHQYHFSSSTVQNIKAIRARGASGQQRSSLTEESDRRDILKPTLQRVDGKVAYEYLLTPHLAHALSGSQVLISLCDLMGKIYRKLVECTAAPSASKELFDAVNKVDSYLEEHFLAPAAKHADTLAKNAMRSSLSKVDPLFARLWGDENSDANDETMERSAMHVTGAI